MTTVHSIVPLLACLASLLAVVPIVVFGERRRNAREVSTFVAGFLKFAFVASMIPAVLGGKVLEFTFVKLAPGVALEFRVLVAQAFDPLLRIREIGLHPLPGRQP